MSLGRWSSPPDAGRLTLSGPSERPTSFALHGDTLRMLGADGKPIDSKLNFDIVRSATAEPMQPKLLLRGMYRYAADAGTFTECVTRMALPVADEGENGALRSAYLKKRTAPDAEMLVTVEGHTTMRPRADTPFE